MREILFGRQAVRESLRADRRQPFALLLLEGIKPAPIVNEIIKLAKQKRLPIKTYSRHDLGNISKTNEHQGIALETSGYPYADIDALLALAKERQEAPLLLVLDLIQDVQNFGSLIRTAEAAGAHGIIIQTRRAAAVTPATVNTASGAVEHLLVARVTNLAREMDQLKAADIWIAGLEEGDAAQNYTQIDMTAPLAIVVGSEGEGLRRLVRERCDWLIALPMRGRVESLNAAIAGSIALYEALKQRSHA